MRNSIKTIGGGLRGLAAGLIALIALAPASAHAMKIQTVTSPGGIEAWLVEEHSLPLIAMQFSMFGGSAQDPDGKPGVANFLTAMMDEGAGDIEAASLPAGDGGARRQDVLRRRARFLHGLLPDADRKPRAGDRAAAARPQQAALRHRLHRAHAPPAAGRHRLRLERPRQDRQRGLVPDRLPRSPLRPPDHRHGRVGRPDRGRRSRGLPFPRLRQGQSAGHRRRRHHGGRARPPARQGVRRFRGQGAAFTGCRSRAQGRAASAGRRDGCAAIGRPVRPRRHSPQGRRLHRGLHPQLHPGRRRL